MTSIAGKSPKTPHWRAQFERRQIAGKPRENIADPRTREEIHRQQLQLVEHQLAQIAQQVGGQPRIEIIAAEPDDRDHDRSDGEDSDNADQQGVVAED